MCHYVSSLMPLLFAVCKMMRVGTYVRSGETRMSYSCQLFSLAQLLKSNWGPHFNNTVELAEI